MYEQDRAVSASSALGPAGTGVWSEVGRLHTVLVHRPGTELHVAAERPTHSLFSDSVRVAEAASEHDLFATALRSRGIEVLYFAELLGEVVRDSRRVGLLSHWLPNLMFPRDPSVWIGDGIALAALASPVRRREADLFALLYREHPRFATVARWATAGATPPAFEGGDVLLAGAGRVIIGSGGRTTPLAAAHLARVLLGTGAATKVAILDFPPWAGFHLDLVLTMVDWDTVAIRSGVREHLRGELWHVHRGVIRADLLADPLMAFLEPVTLIELEEPRPEGHPLSWDHGVNLLTLSPGRVISYAHNERSNERLTAAGIEVIAVPGSELAKGRGGPRCLTCPIVRDGLER
jgi:arginine deiminase